MEVHHHPHSTNHSGRKRWTHYFWEFLMLFLAVFCGFLAEYQLEHKIEKDRERQFMESLVEDLMMDTTNLGEVYSLATQQKLITDSLIDLINNAPLVPENIRRLYQLSANSTRVVDVDFQDRTAMQLKNSGSMRLIRKKMVADSIVTYWQDVERCEAIAGRIDFVAAARADLFAKLFHNKYWIRGVTALAPVTGVKEDAVLINNDPALLAEYSNRTYSRKGSLVIYISNLEWIKNRAVRLMALIRDKY
jgi:hypothetical protein